MVVQIQILFDNLDFATAGSLMRFNLRRRKVLHIGGGGGGGGGGVGARGNQTFRWLLTDRRVPPPTPTSRLQSVPTYIKLLNWYICDLVSTVSHRH